MEIVILPSADVIAALAADAIEAVLASSSAPVIGVATGSSPLKVYDELARRHVEQGLSFAHATAFMLDEYIGLPARHPEAYRAVIERDFASRVGMSSDQVNGPDGTASDVKAACAAYEQALRDAGGVDLQLLGVGTDGHIAFNEPGSSLNSRTRIKTLLQQTREDNARFFDDDIDQVPHHVLTQGLGTILGARHLVLIATGRQKAEAVHQLAEGPVSAMCPASVLQLHNHATVLVDDAAASRLQLSDYYRQAYANKPAWQGI